jgi:mono/diheme cytochrome c family protein
MEELMERLLDEHFWRCATCRPGTNVHRVTTTPKQAAGDSRGVRDRRETYVNETGRRLMAAVAITALLAFGAAACGADATDSGAAGGGGAATGDDLASGSAAARGEQLARSNGCAGCHGANFGGGAGPPLVGLAGSQVSLANGGTVVADTAYLTRAIADPSADLVAGYNLKMPANSLSDAEIADVVAYIETLANG